MRKRRKYGNVRTVVDGIAFDSKREARRWQELRLLEKAGEIGRLRRQVHFALTVRDQQIGRYIADFVFDEKNNGLWREVVEDVKGVRTELYRWKAKHMKAEHGIEIREV